jgi:hypothetical protein
VSDLWWAEHRGLDIHHGPPRLLPWASHFTTIASFFEWDVKPTDSLYQSVMPGQTKDPTQGVNVQPAVDSPSSKYYMGLNGSKSKQPQ